ncbi:MAG: hypothetical protein QM731_16165 [Chitinophagaceae bacterium]
MARQTGVIKRERTIGLLVFYKLGNGYYVRVRSSLSGERVKKSREFINTMTWARRMGIASRLASIIYRQLPPAWKLHDLYRKLTGHAMQLLKEGIDPDLIFRKLEGILQEWGYQAQINYETIQPSTTRFRQTKPGRPRSCTRAIRLIHHSLPCIVTTALYPVILLPYTGNQYQQEAVLLPALSG